MIPELPIAMLPAPLGAPHSVIFGGFTAQAIVDRLEDASHTWSSRLTAAIAAARSSAKGQRGRGLQADDAGEKVIVFSAPEPGEDAAGRDLCGRTSRRTCRTRASRSRWTPSTSLPALTRAAAPASPRHPAHHGGLHGLWRLLRQDGLRPQADDVYWCTADIGWITATRTCVRSAGQRRDLGHV